MEVGAISITHNVALVAEEEKELENNIAIIPSLNMVEKFARVIAIILMRSLVMECWLHLKKTAMYANAQDHAVNDSEFNQRLEINKNNSLYISHTFQLYHF